MLQMIMLCIAVSFDGLGAGISYGSRNIRIPFFPRLIIAFFSASSMALAMILGWIMSRYIHPKISISLGGTILILIGVWVIWQGQSQSKNPRTAVSEPSSISSSCPVVCAGKEQESSVEQDAGRITAFLRFISMDPRAADLDGSGSISPGEALLLGLALASDAFGAGIGVAMSGFSPWVTSLTVGVSKFILLSLGVWAGEAFQRVSGAVPAHFVAGGILILLGIFNIL